MENPLPLWRPRQSIRVIAIGLLKDDQNRLLVAPVWDDSQAIKGWRPLGGGVEFGERVEDALKREFIEETGLDIEILSKPLVLENIFEHEGAIGHEIVYVYDVNTDNPFTFTTIQEGTLTIPIQWIPIQKFKSGEETIYPITLQDHL